MTPNEVELHTTNVFARNRRSKARIVVNRGGTRSSKSWSILQLLTLRALMLRRKKILVLRKSLPSLRLSTLTDFKLILADMGIEKHVREEKMFLNYHFPNGGLMHFDSLDDPRKKKSTNWNYMFLEEADEFSFDDFKTIKLYLTAPPGDDFNQLFMAFNPVDEFCWMKEELLDTDAFDIEEIVSTYRDNLRNLHPDTVRDIEALEQQDRNFWRIYARGEWGRLENLIYTNWNIMDEMPDEPDEEIYGLDFGFNNPSALLRICIKGEQVYEEELLYKTHLTNSELIEEMKFLIPKEKRERNYLFCDSAETDRIEEISQAGFLAVPCAKGKHSVMDGINVVKRCGTIHVSRNSINLKKEKQAYSWKTDRNDRPIDEPVKFKDHLCDAERMALFTYWKEYKGGGADFGGWI